ncbi:MAG: recombinase family protein [Candidatus Saccharimonadales bacterium]
MQPPVQMTNTAAKLLPGEKDGRPLDSIIIKELPVEYCLYARKSSEDDERQALSIDSQIKEMAVQAEAQGLRVTEIRKESHSAKYSGKRPVFEQLIEDVRKGLFTGILSWAPDRLSRNAGDLGSVVDLMDQGKLVEIRTHGQVFTNSPNDKFLLMILCSQAKLENDNRGINVKRGMKTKCELGFRPNMTPLGYHNDHYSGKGQKKVFVDKKRAPIIKEAFEKVATGASGRDIYNWFAEIGFRTKRGKLVTLSMVYRMLNNPYYCGIFEFPVGSGKWYKGSYTPIISRELFDAVQQKMIVAPKSKPGTKQFDYTKLLRCGGCGSGITAQEKYKQTKKHGQKRYVYYHCTQSRNFDCTEPYLREEKLTQAFIRLLAGITIAEIESKETLRAELDRFRRLSAAVLGDAQSNGPGINLQNFAKYILTQGTRAEKRALIACLDQAIYLKDKEVTTKV